MNRPPIHVLALHEPATLTTTDRGFFVRTTPHPQGYNVECFDVRDEEIVSMRVPTVIRPHQLMQALQTFAATRGASLSLARLKWVAGHPSCPWMGTEAEASS